MKKNKSYIVMISIILCLLICIGIIFTISKIKENNKKQDVIYGTVIENNNGLLKLNTVDGETIEILSNEDVNTGDFISVNYYKVGKDSITNVEVIANNYEMVNMTKETTTTTTSTTTTSKKTTTSKTTKNTKKTTTTTSTTTQIIEDKDAYIVTYMEDVYSSVEQEKDEKTLKNYAIKFVDFVFYDGEINGVKFKDLTNTAKSKAIYYALIIDSKIESRFPNYKNDLGDTYKNAKAQLVALYLDTSVKICEKYSKDCENVKSDFELLKTSVGLSWDVVKSCLQYAYDNSISSIKSWYEIWSGKNDN